MQEEVIEKKNRRRELDFLRGIAILLVLFRHQLLFSFLKQMGWIGVDLFFVLSGFLVSGLLFKEFQKFGVIDPKLFLIQRGFKIYPIYYLTYILYILAIIMEHNLKLKKVFFDLVFIQNYALGWGYGYPASWSLAVEEHFYFGLVLLLWLIFNKKLIRFNDFTENRFSAFEKLLLVALVCVFILRIISNIEFPNQMVRNTTMSHLRIDSLLAGVLISYWYHFKRNKLILYYSKYQKYLLVLSFFFISFTPFIEPIGSFFVKTIGFTMLYIAFGILILHFLLDSQINSRINRIFSTVLVSFISKIRFSSYSIYVIHSFVIYLVRLLNLDNRYLCFLLVSVVSIGTGFLMTYKVEKCFLNYRDQYFPSRAI
ncbi:Peptidoglycan/LPS O-acetylase OafA/YrhL, contains acyltransferase and SGNH-hydrolase domains [Flavobacterium fluvii]|uniref:Peptidoglycan/LPS O-acetylase OafA/YrhL, contains acyltransferase and SGNH-hydrolase domains n=2 Tax=Flavobacterium fluvii TaxID=468056 RepID=A0A1M5IR38_9FLAO|nr:Peptidoglycan/LPS O-acetylase OafA/YrhL, contains acyltransferase and SGNH-hydrolase domains [Flavobacterium fluvii]